ncbi:MAG: hypothetical protein JWP78_616 [Mucilaginibacter sp.]|nr:hypothetical protein [Mucilaginibacter sp.]
MIFKWSTWGNKTQINNLLYPSVISFQKWFGKNHSYILFTDNIEGFSKQTLDLLEVHLFDEYESIYNVDSIATWKKWCPTPRLDITQTEFYIDSDVFLLKSPVEILDFLENPRLKYCILDEFQGEKWQHGCMSNIGADSTPFVNAGLFIQKVGCDITSALTELFYWWSKNIPVHEQTHHDEQGALAIVLAKYFINYELLVLPKDKYAIISKYQNVEIESLENIVLMHSTYPNHPAFYRFKSEISRILGIEH